MPKNSKMPASPVQIECDDVQGQKPGEQSLLVGRDFSQPKLKEEMGRQGRLGGDPAGATGSARNGYEDSKARWWGPAYSRAETGRSEGVGGMGTES
jgi:hypothetical protein